LYYRLFNQYSDMENEPKRAGAGLYLAQLNLNRPEFQRVSASAPWISTG